MTFVATMYNVNTRYNFSAEGLALANGVHNNYYSVNRKINTM